MHFTGVGTPWAQLDSHDEIMTHAFSAMRKGADMYYTLRSYDVMEKLSKEGIPVHSHIGLIPTFSHYCGGLRGWGRNAEEAMQIFQTLKRMEDVGVFAVEAECIAEEVLEVINQKTSIVTFSLGSGIAGDVIMSFVADICGEDSEEKKPPKHAYAFGDVGRLHKQIHEERVTALNKFSTEVSAGKFPYPQTNISMHKGEKDKLLEAIDKWKPIHQ
jgi:3-methyl-2-oxobutanoate hydroxymethyltransferase